MKESIDGLWSMPGGWADINLSVKENIIKIFVLCDLIDYEFKNNIETEECKFFNLENLPELSIARNTKEQIEMCFESYRKNIFDTIFD